MGLLHRRGTILGWNSESLVHLTHGRCPLPIAQAVRRMPDFPQFLTAAGSNSIPDMSSVSS